MEPNYMWWYYFSYFEILMIIYPLSNPSYNRSWSKNNKKCENNNSQNQIK